MSRHALDGAPQCPVLLSWLECGSPIPSHCPPRASSWLAGCYGNQGRAWTSLLSPRAPLGGWRGAPLPQPGQGWRLRAVKAAAPGGRLLRRTGKAGAELELGLGWVQLLLQQLQRRKGKVWSLSWEGETAGDAESDGAHDIGAISCTGCTSAHGCSVALDPSNAAHGCNIMHWLHFSTWVQLCSI